MRTLLAGLFGVVALSGCSQPVAAPITDAEIADRYVSVALSCEYADCPTGLVKPRDPVSVIVHGPARDDQIAALDDTISQWNDACASVPLVRDGKTEVVMDFYFVDEAAMPEVLPVFVEGNVGLFNYDWDGTNAITGMTVAIANEIDGNEMKHFVLEETTQAMGLVNDVDDSSSIFDAGMGRVVTYSPIDRLVIEAHCRSDVVSGMTAEELPL